MNVLVEKCCGKTDSNTSCGAGLKLAGGTVVNATVAGNTAVSGTTAGLVASAGTLANSIVWANDLIARIDAAE